MTSLSELLAQRAEIEQRIAQLQTAERLQAIETIKKLIAEHGLTPADIHGRPKTLKAATKPEGSPKQVVPPKYRNASTGQTWSGRGLQPRWLKAALAEGQTLESFAI